MPNTPSGTQAKALVAAQPVSLPRDEGPHDVPLEWWYYTGHLASAQSDGSTLRWGFQVTVFKRKSSSDLYLGNFAITDHQTQHFSYAERPWANAASGSDYALDLGGWQLSGKDGHDKLLVSQGDYTLDLALTGTKPAVLHGQDGVIGSGQTAADYYSRTRMALTGTLTQAAKAHSVSGEAWMDHEWFPNTVEVGDLSWDWFSIQLEDDREIMLGVSRVAGKSSGQGSWVEPSGKATHLSWDEVSVEALDHWTSPASGQVFPMGWTLSIPGRDLTLRLTPVLRDQEWHGLQLTPIDYWEGEVEVSGTEAGKTVHGQGYVELTGYQ